MDGLVVLFVLLGGAYLLVLPVLTLIAWSRSSTHSDQIEKLRRALKEAETRNASLDTRLNSLQAAVQTLRERGDVNAPPSPIQAPAAEPIVVKPATPVAAAASGAPMPIGTSSAPEPIKPPAAKPALVASPAIKVAADLTFDLTPPSTEANPAEMATVTRPAEGAPADSTPKSTPRRPAPRVRPAPAQPAGPSLLERAFGAAKAWLFGGNTLVRMGMLLVFLGLAFLLRYASDRIVIPLEVRYLGVAITALVALVLGWRLRAKRPAYALLMQGGAVAVMYLTVFAALKLHGQPLLSTEAGFALLVAVVTLSGVLAVAQNALSLAVAGALGGFATPVLLSTGGGNHVALFTYFALLNTGILGIAWFKAWRPLNLIGFFGTFLIGTAWGQRSYDPVLHYANTQPFLILFFVMFVAIGLLFARRMLLDDPDVPTSRDTAEWSAWFARRGHTAQRYVDGTLLFGTPVVAFGLQYALIRHIEYGTAFSSLALGLFYLVLARLTHGSNPLRHRLLTEVFLALGMIFASLAIPLGLDAQWTAAAWAIEAAGIYWIGHRQQRPLARAFALLLQAGATVAFLQHVSPGEETLLTGSALGALMLGLSFLSNMLVLRRYGTAPERSEQWDGKLDVAFSTLGLWSLFAIAPILYVADGTAFAWGLAGFLTVFVALRWRFSGWVLNAVLVQVAAIMAFVTTLHPAQESLLAGSLVVAALLGITLLANAALLRLHPGACENGQSRYNPLLPLLSTLGLWSLYLIAPLQLAAENTAAAWALAGMLTVFIGLRLQARGWVANALLVQLLAGGLFLRQMDADGGAGGVLALAGSGWRGLIIASLIGLASLVSLGAAVRDARRKNDPALVARLAWATIFGLGFIALAVLFVLPWETATAVWAGCGFVLMWAAMHLKLRPPFWFALALEIIAGIAFLNANWFGLFNVHPLQVAEAASPFAHAGFWTPIVIALAAFAVAWRLHAYARSPTAGDADGLAIDGDWFSLPALLWAAGWWAFAWWMEWARTDELHQQTSHHFLAVMAASVLVLLPIAVKWRWARLAGLCGLLLPLIAVTAAFDYGADFNLLAASGWAALGLALAAAFGLLRSAKGLLEERSDKLLHLINCWVWLGVAALEMRYLFLALGEPGSTWRWLGWVLPLAAWLLWNARKAPPSLWPAVAHPQLYRFSATAPLLAILLAWLGMANIYSSGNAEPLPFIPLLNPLDLPLVLILFAGWQWLRQLRVQDPLECRWQPLSTPFQFALMAAAFLTYTCVVLRGAHHLAGVPWQPDEMQHSMLVQASLSIAWALLALGLMVAGHRSARRAVWIAGAVLVAVVLAKLFLIELSNRGGVERIVSFIGVGVLLLVVGYFAPLPPSRETTDTESADAPAT